MNMRITAKATPAIATVSRIFCRRSWSQARRAPEIIAVGALGLDRDLDLQVREPRGLGAVVELHAHLDDARVGTRDRVGVEHVLLSDLHADAIDRARELA